MRIIGYQVSLLQKIGPVVLFLETQREYEWCYLVFELKILLIFLPPSLPSSNKNTATSLNRCPIFLSILDVDECDSSLNPCDPLASCQNTVGSFQCLCQSGYTGDRRTCTGKRYWSKFLLMMRIFKAISGVCKNNDHSNKQNLGNFGKHKNIFLYPDLEKAEVHSLTFFETSKVRCCTNKIAGNTETFNAPSPSVNQYFLTLHACLIHFRRRWMQFFCKSVWCKCNMWKHRRIF